jgi:hypothetical protein
VPVSEDILIRRELEKCHNQLFKVRKYSVSFTVLIFFWLTCNYFGVGLQITDTAPGRDPDPTLLISLVANKKPNKKLVLQIVRLFSFLFLRRSLKMTS